MGQQQLLLIVLGVIVVGIAVVAGINLFSASKNEAVKDELVSQSMAIAANAQQWFAKPVSMGGGGNYFTTTGGAAKNYDIPTTMKGTTNGTYACVPTDTLVTVTATPRVVSGTNYGFANVTCKIGPTTISTTVN
jgi:type II secretory pathway pseudopilin PulG